MDIDLHVDDNTVALERHDVLYESQSSYHSACSFSEILPLPLSELDRQAIAAEEGRQKYLQDLQDDAHPPFRDRLISW